jgi:hypothetical protein
MKPIVPLIILLLFSHPILAEERILFDGKSLSGWKATSDANWRVENGEIRVDAGNEGWLMTTAEYGDYELHVEFKAPATTNSGIFLRTKLAPTDPTKDCYEINIAPVDNPFPTGSLVARIKAQARPTLAGRETWHTFELSANGPTITVILDSEQVASLTDPQHILRGHIGLQFREGPVAFRNIRLKPLGKE